MFCASCPIETICSDACKGGEGAGADNRFHVCSSHYNWYFAPLFHSPRRHSHYLIGIFSFFFFLCHSGLNWCSRWRGNCWAFHPPLCLPPSSRLPTWSLSSLATSISKAWSICMTSYSKLRQHVLTAILSIVFWACCHGTCEHLPRICWMWSLFFSGSPLCPGRR